MTERPDLQLSFLRELADGRTTIAGHVLEVGTDTWAIHGSIPVDGGAILAEYRTRAEAERALGALSVRPVDGCARGDAGASV